MKPLLKVVRHDLGVDVEKATIVPISDLHIGAEFDEDMFLGFRKWILERENTYCVILGDVLEMATRQSVGSTYGTLRPKDQRALAVKYLKPLADEGRILGYIDGNHESRATKETDEYPGEIICQLLGIPSLFDPDGIYMFLSVGHNPAVNKKARNIYTIFMLHGWSGARTMGGKANNLLSLRNSAIADLYIMAHVHDQLATPKRILYPDVRTKKLKWKRQVFTLSGSFLEWSGYAINKGFNPSELGAPIITLGGKAHKVSTTI